MPLVSIVMPVYNGEKYLAQSLESVFAQTHRPLEVLAVDDGSTDGSARLLASYGSRVTVIRQANAGVGPSRNAGIRAARGDLVAFLDQDDWWLPDKLARQVALFQADADLGLVHTDVHYFHEDSGAYVAGFPRPGPHLLAGRCYDRLLFGNDIIQSSAVVRRALFERVGVIDVERVRGNTVQDYDLWLRLARVSSFGYVAEKLAVYRLHAQQGTWNARPFLTELLRVLERVLAADDRSLAPAMKVRLAEVLQNLALAHLDAREHRQARRYLHRALQLHRSPRSVLLWLASLLPPAGIAAVRSARARLRGKKAAIPSWARTVAA